MQTSATLHADKKMVLTKAIFNIVNFYHFTGKELSEILGISESSATRLHQGNKFIAPDTKEGEMALLLVRVYRSLNALVGNDHEKAKRWLNGLNHYFKKKPIDEMKTISGLVAVVNYLDGMRGKL